MGLRYVSAPDIAPPSGPTVAKPSGEHTPPGGFVSKEVPMDWFFYILEFLDQFDGASELGVAGLTVFVTIQNQEKNAKGCCGLQFRYRYSIGEKFTKERTI